MNRIHITSVIALSSLALLLAACSSSPSIKTKAAHELCSGTKRPYEINGKTYVPQDHYHYDEEGQASWYGPNFDGKPGACGSKYDMYAYTAAHKTLPIPSVVEVTNLDNGRKIKLIVNDRGPFVGDRIIDLSKKAAMELGTNVKGLGNVRVKALPEDSIALATYLKQFGRYGIDPSGRPWDVIYREEIISREGKETHLLADVTPYTTSMQNDPENIVKEAMERAIHEEVEKELTSPTAPYLVQSPYTAAAPSSKEPMIQSISYAPRRRPPLSSREQEHFDMMIEDLTGRERTVTRKTIQTKKYPSKAGQRQSPHFIQVGSFVNQRNADKLVKDLSVYGKAQVIQETPHFYTVQLGPYPSQGQAKKVMSTVINKGHHGVRLIPTYLK